MPSKNARKIFRPQSFYHIYNRGTKKQPVFLQEKDYWRWRQILASTLLEFEGTISITHFAFLPNHLHLLIWQQSERDITRFMRKITNRYAFYLQKEYNWVGHVFQGVYKASYLYTKKERRRIEKYILDNPKKHGYVNWKHVGRGSDLWRGPTPAIGLTPP